MHIVLGSKILSRQEIRMVVVSFLCNKNFQLNSSKIKNWYIHWTRNSEIDER